jgi:hypothetical protein
MTVRAEPARIGTPERRLEALVRLALKTAAK